MKPHCSSLLLALAASACWAATPAGNPQGAEEARCLSQSAPTRDCYQLLRVVVGADRIRVQQLQTQVSQLKKALRAHRVPPRSRQELAHANQVFDSEFGYLRNTPGAFALASDLVLEQMKDPRYVAVPLDMIVRDVASRVQRVASAGNETLAAEAEAAKREAAQAHEDAAREVNAAYDDAQHVVNAAQAIAQQSSSDADTTAALAILNAATPGPATPAPSPSVHCTSRTVGQGQYARTETDCN